MTLKNKGLLIIKGLELAKCKYCGKNGVTRLCKCQTNLTLAERYYRLDFDLKTLAGPIGKLP